MQTEDSEPIYKACKLSDRLFVLNPEFKRNNFYSQQLRALALIEAMVRNGDLAEGARNVAVVGAGVAGLTAAAALMTVNAHTTVIDRDEPMDSYRDATHRELHPNIIFWPFAQLRSITDLPFLNWCCGPASEVRTRILDQWERYFRSQAEPFIKADVERFEETETSILIFCKDRAEPIRKDRAVVCMGHEKDADALKIGCPQYWGAPPQREDQGAITVSGIGDGGLIDVAYQFYGTEAVAASRALAYRLKGRPLESDIKEVERTSLDLVHTKRDEASKKLTDFYGKFSLTQGAQEVLKEYERSKPPAVTLIHRQIWPYSPFAAPINRLMFAHCQAHFGGRVTLKHGELVFPGNGEVDCVSNGIEEPLDPRKTVVRHTPKAAVYATLSAEQKDRLRERAQNALLMNGITKDKYDEDQFLKMPPQQLAPRSCDDDPKEFLDDLVALVDTLLSHVMKPKRIVEIRRSRKRITVKADDVAAAAVASNFPVSIQSVSIAFERYVPDYAPIAESSAKRYTYKTQKRQPL